MFLDSSFIHNENLFMFELYIKYLLTNQVAIKPYYSENGSFNLQNVLIIAFEK